MTSLFPVLHSARFQTACCVDTHFEVQHLGPKSHFSSLLPFSSSSLNCAPKTWRNLRITAMDSDVAFATSNLPSLDEELSCGTTAFTAASLEKDLAALQLDVLPEPLTGLPCSHTTVEVSKASTVALQPQPEPQRQQSQPLASELARYDSALSMRSLLTESTFSIGTTIDSCPPSPTLSAHVAKPTHRGSWSSNSYQMPGSLCRVNTWPTLRAGGQKSRTCVNNQSLASPTQHSNAFAGHQSSTLRNLVAQKMARLIQQANPAASKRS